MNEYTYPENENFLENNEPISNEELTSYELSKLDADTQFKLAHLSLKNKQGRELINLQNNDASIKEENNLQRLHKKEEEEFFIRHYSLSSTINEKQRMRKIQEKDIINVKEYTEIYGDSKTTQKNDRGKRNNPLPYHQKVEGGKITYKVSEIEEWQVNNNHK